jgi:hypothetical protein
MPLAGLHERMMCPRCGNRRVKLTFDPPPTAARARGRREMPRPRERAGPDRDWEPARACLLRTKGPIRPAQQKGPREFEARPKVPPTNQTKG